MSWIQTWSGAQADPMAMRPDMVRARDVAHSLARLCRFAGHAARFYSVAEHCCHMRDLVVPAAFRAQALLHDAFEAYSADIPRPVKRDLFVRVAGMFVPYGAVEAAGCAVVMRSLGVEPTHKSAEVVHALDLRMLAAERLQVFADDLDWGDMPEPADVVLRFWQPEEAEAEFLRRLDEDRRAR